jgi:hypothetical protein
VTADKNSKYQNMLQRKFTGVAREGNGKAKTEKRIHKKKKEGILCAAIEIGTIM